MKIEAPYGTTKKGNEYKKSNIAGALMGCEFIGGIGLSAVGLATDAFVKKRPNTNKLKLIMQSVKKKLSGKVGEYALGCLATLNISALIADFIIERKRAKDADNKNN